ncbi:MAG: 16S rRNA (guanine(966)-N(2))-methyltransferase RsmD [Anaerolineae bacterium]|nr:16S rRNA (guanine(966)-N(2))-methyltransferase RsmD [Anaerolineae bacterium]
MSRLRVISGTARGRKLSLVPGDSTRPISDRVKEALFNILGLEINGAKVLDLFAGTGSVGIEALSRGAAFVRFIDRNRLAINTVQQNLATTGFTENINVLQHDAFAVLASPPDLHFDYIYVAPPQFHDLWKQAIIALDKNPDWLVADGWVIAQIDFKEYEALPLNNLDEFDQRKYGNTRLVFYERKQLADG